MRRLCVSVPVPRAGGRRARADGRITFQSRHVDEMTGGNFLGDRLSLPDGDDRLARLDRRDVDLGRCERQGRGVGVHLVDERPERSGDPHSGEGPGRDHQEIPAGHAGAHFMRINALCAGRSGYGMRRVRQILPLALELRLSQAHVVNKAQRAGTAQAERAAQRQPNRPPRLLSSSRRSVQPGGPAMATCRNAATAEDAVWAPGNYLTCRRTELDVLVARGGQSDQAIRSCRSVAGRKPPDCRSQSRA